MSSVMLRDLQRPLKIGVFLTADTTELIDVAQVAILHSLTKEFLSSTVDLDDIPAEFHGEMLDMDFFWLSEDGGKRSLTTLDVESTTCFDECPPLDILMTGAGTKDAKCTAAELNFIRHCYNSGTIMLLICTGMMPALQAGILSGKTCTAPRTALPELRQNAPDVNWVERRWCNDGTIWTSGTAANGLDAVREFVLQTWGHAGKPSLCRFLLQTCGVPIRGPDYAEEDSLWESA